MCLIKPYRCIRLNNTVRISLEAVFRKPHFILKLGQYSIENVRQSLESCLFRLFNFSSANPYTIPILITCVVFCRFSVLWLIYLLRDMFALCSDQVSVCMSSCTGEHAHITCAGQRQTLVSSLLACHPLTYWGWPQQVPYSLKRLSSPSAFISMYF